MATDVLNFLSAHYQGFLVAILFSFSLALLLQWVCWIFGWGRFAGSQTITRDGGRLQSLRFLIADALTKIVNDFRHLLALILVSIFALALVYVLYASNKNMGQIKEGLQAVVATLGGLVGSIIGYYFGESSARASSTPTGGGSSNLPPVLPPDDGSAPEIKPAPEPGATADLSVKDEVKGG